MKLATLVLMSLMSFNALATVKISVHKTMATSADEEAQQLTDALSALGAKGFADRKSGEKHFDVMGTIAKVPANCALKQYRLSLEMRELRNIYGGEGIELTQISVQNPKGCELNSPGDTLRKALLIWGAQQLGTFEGVLGFRINCDQQKALPGAASPINCFVELESARD